MSPTSPCMTHVCSKANLESFGPHRPWLLVRLQGGAVGGVSSSGNGSGPGSAPAQAPEDIALSMEDFQQIRWASGFYCGSGCTLTQTARPALAHNKPMPALQPRCVRLCTCGLGCAVAVRMS